MNTVNSVEKEKIWDVVVLGGGLAGAAAAVAAAREGNQVLLVERYGFLGGMATAGLVNPFMAYCSKYGEGEKFNWDKIANAGIFLSIIRDLDAMGGLHSNRMTFHPELLKIVLDRMVVRYGIQVLFHSFIAETETEGDRIKSVTAVTKGGNYRLQGRVFVDATGDADIAAQSGCPYEMGNEDGLCQPMTLCFDMGNVDTSVYAPVWGWYDGSYSGNSEECARKVNKAFQERKAKGNLTCQNEGVSTYASCVSGVIHFNTTRFCGTVPMEVKETSLAEMAAREQMWEISQLMRECAPGFENASLLTSGTQIGVRESRRIVGDIVIHEEDIMNCVKFEDSIARGTYCIDIHNVKEGQNGGGMQDIPYNDFYTIPYRALLPQKIKNLIVAGRPISSTHIAHGAHRVMPICTSVGEGAGTAAALALKCGCDFRKIELPLLHGLLHQNGALY